ncbi:MAG TPA: hypothetical protein VMK05_06650 [Burkholderiales bacterium]|nr:hypothetical protein [Burkholderiales bacterium]
MRSRLLSLGGRLAEAAREIAEGRSRAVLWTCRIALAAFLAWLAWPLLPLPSYFGAVAAALHYAADSAPAETVAAQRAGIGVVGAWLCLIAGLALAVAVGRSARAPLGRLARIAPASNLHDHALRAALAAATLAGSVAVKRVDLAWADFDRAGGFLLLYSLGRLAICAGLTLLLVNLGAGLLRRIDAAFSPLRPGPAAFLALSFFCGASALAIAVTALGLVGLLNLPAAVLLTVLLCLPSPRWLRQLAGMLRRRLARIAARAGRVQVTASVLLGFFVCAMLALVVVMRGLYPATNENDVWEHYLHYYREVLHSGSLGPNPVWYHFYLSKGAGLFFYTGLLSDVFAPQLVSICFLLLTCVIAFTLLARLLRSSLWGLTGVVMLLGLYGSDPGGSYFKAHVVFAGYAAFIVWAATVLLRPARAAACAVLFATAISLLYVAFYQPIPASILCAGLLLLVIVRAIGGVALKRQTALLGLLVLAAVGAVGALLLNYTLTGMAADVPIRLFWKFADREKFVNLFGASGPRYFLHVDNDLAALRDWSGAWLARVLRADFFGFLLDPPLLAIGTGVLSYRLLRGAVPGRPPFRHGAAVAVLAALSVPALAFAQAFQLESTIRVFLFASLLVVLVALPSIAVTIAGVLPRRLAGAAAALVATLLAMSAIAAAISSVGSKWSLAPAFLTGKRSLLTTLNAAEHGLNQRRMAGIGTFQAIRRIAGPHEKILYLSFDPGFGYFLPGDGGISEPGYALGPSYDRIVRGDPEQAASLLRDLHIRYFFLDLRSVLFSGVAFGRLFAPDELSRRFRVAYANGDNYLLELREPGEDANIPADLVRRLDLKREVNLNYPFSGRFASDLDAAHGAAEVRARLARQMTSPALSPENRALLDRLFEKVDAELARSSAQSPEARAALLQSLRTVVRDFLAQQLGPAAAGAIATEHTLAPSYNAFQEIYRDRH